MFSKDKVKEICYKSVVYEVKPGKKDPNRTRITICGTNVCYPRDVGTNTASLELFKLMINSILSRAGAKYVCFDIENFYFSTPLDKPEYVKIQLSKMLQEYIDEYDLTKFSHKGWVYFEIRRGCYGLPQSAILANKQLRTILEKRGLLWGQNNTGYMETQMATNTVLFNCWWLWSRICLETKCRSLGHKT